MSGACTVVTGASGGIGEVVARRLIARGEAVLAVARNVDRLRALCGDAPHARFAAVDLERSDAVEAVARAVRIPFAVGGGISTLADMERVILAGAEKVSVNSLAVRNPSIIAEGAKAFGSQCIVLGMDPVKSVSCPSGYEITTRGFRDFTGMDAVEWAKRAVDFGAGEIVVNSVDADGTRGGFELGITRLVADAVPVPVVASGGAGMPEHFVTVFDEAHADAAIVAGMIHTGDYTIADIKAVMNAAGIPTRMSW